MSELTVAIICTAIGVSVVIYLICQEVKLDRQRKRINQQIEDRMKQKGGSND